jgi:lipopolysaccharide export system permease protein
LTRFDRHLVARFLTATVFLVGLLVVFFVVLDYVEYIDDFMDRGATMEQVFGTYYLHYVPEIVKLVSPLAVFLAAIYTVARLSQSMQLAALTMAGVSLYRVALPLAACGALIAGAMLWFNGFVVPPANAVVQQFQNEYYKDAPDGPEMSDIQRQTGPRGVLTVGFYDREAERGYRIGLQHFAQADSLGERRVTHYLYARDMAWVDSLGHWTLGGITERRFLADGSEERRKRGDLDTVLAVLPRDLARTSRDAERLTIPEARDYVRALQRAGVAEIGRPLVAYHAKFAYPLANLVLVVVGVALAAVRRRGGQAAQFGIGLGVAFVYLALQKVIEPLGYVETIPPAVAAWVPHVLFGLLALVLLWRAPK